MTMSARRGDEVEAGAALRAVDDLVSPYGGLLSSTGPVNLAWGDPGLKARAASLGEISHLLDLTSHPHEVRLSGVGRSLDEDTARRIAVVEAVERYASCFHAGTATMVATASELGVAAMDLSSLPRSSRRELDGPRCPVRPADPGLPIRWTEAVDLHSGRAAWVPAVMVYLHLEPWPAECFWLQISTGCAAHTDMRSALAGAINEVVERDAVALTWLQRLRLPRIPDDSLSPAALGILRGLRRSNVQPLLFDATTDLGIPTVYSLQLADADERVAQLVGCAVGESLSEAALKTLTESSASRVAVRRAADPPAEIADFRDTLDGAAYLGRRERRDAFGFLLEAAQAPRPATSPAARDREADPLDRVLAALRRHDFAAYAVDLTTREAEAVGIHVVRAIVPGLQPLSFRPRAQYRGHPRLYEAPAAMGYPVLSEAELNPWPQPFP